MDLGMYLCFEHITVIGVERMLAIECLDLGIIAAAHNRYFESTNRTMKGGSESVTPCFQVHRRRMFHSLDDMFHC